MTSVKHLQTDLRRSQFKEGGIMRGYKAFNRDMTCTMGRGVFQYEVGKTYEEEGYAQSRAKGFHFCLTLENVYKFYPKDSIVCEIEALGDIEGDGLAYATNKIRIVKEIVK